MKFIPILFSTPMVQAIQDLRKTKTRRTKGLEIANKFPDQNKFIRFQEYPDGSIRAIFENGDGDVGNVKCPYKKGDILWVRETWQMICWDYEDGMFTANYAAGGNQECIIEEEKNDWLVKQIEKMIDGGYYAPYSDDDEIMESTGKQIPWRPNIFMPKEACRIFLKIKSIKVERLQDISEEDAIAEGILFYDSEVLGRRFKDYEADVTGYGNPSFDYPTLPSARESFRSLWRFINGPESWNLNPWVWVIEFERIEKPENFI